MKHVLSLALMMCFLMLSAGAFAEKSDEGFAGYWYTEKNQSIIQITKKDGQYVGKILWLKKPNYEEGDPEAGKPKRDRNNPSKKKRSQTIVGLSIMSKFSYDAKTEKWTGGLIYDPESGKNYKCEAHTETDPNNKDQQRLAVRGYIGIPKFGRTTHWTPVPKKDLEKHKLVVAKATE